MLTAGEGGNDSLLVRPVMLAVFCHCPTTHIVPQQPDPVNGVTSGEAWAHLEVRGGHEELVKAAVDPGEPEMEQVVEANLAPPHAHTLEALLDQPLAGALDHAAADG